MKLNEYLEQLLYKECLEKKEATIDSDEKFLKNSGIKEVFAAILSKHTRKELEPLVKRAGETNKIMQKWYNELLKFCRKNKIEERSAVVLLDIGLIYKYIKRHKLSYSECKSLAITYPKTWGDILKIAEQIKKDNPDLSDSNCKRLAIGYPKTWGDILKIAEQIKKENPDLSDSDCKRLAIGYGKAWRKIVKIIRQFQGKHPDWPSTKLTREAEAIAAKKK